MQQQDGADHGELADGPHAEDTLAAMRWRAEAEYALDASHNLGLLQRRAAAVSEAERWGLIQARRPSRAATRSTHGDGRRHIALPRHQWRGHQLRSRLSAQAWRWVRAASAAPDAGHVEPTDGDMQLQPRRIFGTRGAAPEMRAGDGRPPPLTPRGGRGVYGGACALLSEGNSALSECSCGLHLFQSAARAKVLELCGWQVCRDPAALEAAVAELEAAGMLCPAHVWTH